MKRESRWFCDSIALSGLAGLFLACGLPVIAAAQGEAYPQRPVRIVVPVSAGGGVDQVARLVGQHFHAVWAQPFVVAHRSSKAATGNG